jgi:hypothetical protein
MEYMHPSKTTLSIQTSDNNQQACQSACAVNQNADRPSVSTMDTSPEDKPNQAKQSNTEQVNKPAQLS